MLHFNVEHPENHNIKITNKKEPFALVWNDPIWEIRKKKSVVKKKFVAKTTDSFNLYPYFLRIGYINYPSYGKKLFVEQKNGKKFVTLFIKTPYSIHFSIKRLCLLKPLFI